LRDRGIEFEIVDYLKHPPSVEELENVLEALGMEPRDLMRRKEKEYRSLGLADQSLTRGQLVAAMVQHPRLIERPVAISDDRFVLGRPPENFLELVRVKRDTAMRLGSDETRHPR
jgi:arsenate reductase